MKAVLQSSASVAIVGGGVAGLAAGAALAEAGFRVTLLERKPYVGGRASSYQYPGVGEVIDNCQHVLLGCCTNLIDLYRRIGAEALIRWYDCLTFLEPGGRRSVIGSSWLPAPLHSAPSFLSASCLSWRDKTAIAGALRSLLFKLPQDDGRPFSDWLRARSQPAGALEHFWKVVLVGALNEDLDRVSISAAAMVFRESFLKSAAGGHMGLPKVPLSELYSRAAEYIVARGGSLELCAPVDQFELIQEQTPVEAAKLLRWRAAPFHEASHPQGTEKQRLEEAVTGSLSERPWSASRSGVRLSVKGQSRGFDYAILAIPFDGLEPLLPRTAAADGLRAQLSRFETSPITGVHLWFDRQITDLEHAVLLDRTIQWMFHKSRILEPVVGQPLPPKAAGNGQGKTRQTGASGGGEPGTGGSYIELVVSASKTLVNRPRQEIIDLAVRELGEFFPAVKGARLVKATVVKELHATFAPLPGSDSYRPATETPWPRVFLAGDWTATGWPAIMEGAVRSGYVAAEALCRSAGRNDRFLRPNLPPSGLMRWLP
jgi:zeta-carotene desaturase